MKRVISPGSFRLAHSIAIHSGLIIALSTGIPALARADTIPSKPASGIDSDLANLYFSVQGVGVGNWTQSQLTVNGALTSAGLSVLNGSGQSVASFTSTGTGSVSSTFSAGGAISSGGSISATGSLSGAGATISGSSGLTLTNSNNSITLLPSSANGTYTLYAAGFQAGNSITAPAYYHNSDARLKTAIHPIGNALDKLLTIQGVEFNWRKDGRPDMGVVAQNVAQVFPNVVAKDSTGTMSVEYDSLIGPMIEAIRVLKNDNDALRQKVAAMDDMKAQLSDLRQTVDALKRQNGQTHAIKYDETHDRVSSGSLNP